MIFRWHVIPSAAQMTFLTHCLTSQQRCRFPTKQVLSMGDLFSHLFTYFYGGVSHIFFTVYWGSSWYDWRKSYKNHGDSNKRCCGCIVKYRIWQVALCHLSPFFLAWVAVQSHLVVSKSCRLSEFKLNRALLISKDRRVVWKSYFFLSFTNKRRSLKNFILFTCNISFLDVIKVIFSTPMDEKKTKQKKLWI